MKNLNQRIRDYTSLLQQGEIQLAYKGILEFLGKLRADFIRRYPQYDTGNVYQGYMDMSYFSLSTQALKEKGLKIAIVYLHEKGIFEAWLSARNREISKRFESVFSENISDDLFVYHDRENLDAMIECTLTSAPDFEDQASLTDMICQGVEKFMASISNVPLS